MSVKDVSDVILQVGPVGGPYATIADLRSYDATHSQENDSKVRVFGQASPYVRAGDLIDAYNFSGLYNPEDTNGQNVLRSSRDNGTTMAIRIMPEGVDSGDDGYMQEVRCTEYAENAEADGDYVQCSFTLDAVGARTSVTI